jgi:glycosyltransferase involved in cell wall biosynthesis
MKILQLCKKFPYPAKDGEAIAVLQMSKALSSCGCEVSLLAMNTSRHYVDLNDGLPADLNYYKDVHFVSVDNRIHWFDALTNLFKKESYHISRFISADYSSKLIEVLKNNHFDIIQLETLYLAPFLPVIKQYSDAMIVLRAHNIEHEIWSRIASQVKFIPKKLYLHYLSNKLKKFEISTLNEYDFLVAITERDLAHFKSLGYKNGCISSPVGFDLSQYHADYKAFSGPMKISFIGSLDWMPNIEAVRWFLSQVWPLVNKKFPTLEFHFAGRNAPPDLANVNLNQVFYHPEVSDAKSFMLEYPVFIVPIFAGSGIRVKILEAMALGRVVITTSIGLEGIPARHKEQVILANSVNDFLESIQQCYDQYPKIIGIGENAQSFVSNQFDSSKLAGKLIHAYKKVLNLHTHN